MRLFLKNDKAFGVCLGDTRKALFPEVQAVIADTKRDSGLEPVPPMDVVDGQHCVGYTIDMSVNLGNSLQNEVHDASQCFSIWTEELSGHADNWFFIMRSIYGKTRPDGKPFSGLAVKLHRGTTTSWDDRVVIQHCMSLSKLDGADGPVVKRGGIQRFKNHVYGTLNFYDCSEGKDFTDRKSDIVTNSSIDKRSKFRT
jgi:hypothetical protein